MREKSSIQRESNIFLGSLVNPKKKRLNHPASFQRLLAGIHLTIFSVPFILEESRVLRNVTKLLSWKFSMWEEGVGGSPFHSLWGWFSPTIMTNQPD